MKIWMITDPGGPARNTAWCGCRHGLRPGGLRTVWVIGRGLSRGDGLGSTTSHGALRRSTTDAGHTWTMVGPGFPVQEWFARFTRRHWWRSWVETISA